MSPFFISMLSALLYYNQNLRALIPKQIVLSEKFMCDCFYRIIEKTDKLQ